MTSRSSKSTADLVQKVQGVAEAPGKRTTQQIINDMAPQFARALPTQVDADRFARIAYTTIRYTPKLLECSEESIAGALLLCAQLGLEPGGPRQQAHLIPRWNSRLKCNEATYQLGYRGIMDLARRSGEITDIQAREVCENDLFEWEYGLDETLRHRHADGDRGPLVGAYCLARFKSGGHFFVVLSDETIRKHHESRAHDPHKATSPWQTDRAAMYRKTAVVAAGPYLPLSVQAMTAIVQDGTVHTETELVDLADMETPPPSVIDVPSEETSPEPGPGTDGGTGEGVVVTPPPGCTPEGCQFFGEEHANCLKPGQGDPK